MSYGVNWNGTIPFDRVEYDITIDEFGVGSSTVYYQWEWTGPSDAANRITSIESHPDFSWLKRSNARINREEANFAKASVSFVGVPPNTDKKNYKLSGSLGSAPIETHPRFQELVAEGFATFDPDDGSLIWSEEVNGEVNELFGTESWLQPTLVYEEVHVRGKGGSQKDFSKLGKIQNPPKSRVRPTTPEGSNFLFIGGDIEEIGFGSRMTRRWKLSGPGGWSDELYTKRSSRGF